MTQFPRLGTGPPELSSEFIYSPIRRWLGSQAGSGQGVGDKGRKAEGSREINRSLVQAVPW